MAGDDDEDGHDDDHDDSGAREARTRHEMLARSVAQTLTKCQWVPRRRVDLGGLRGGRRYGSQGSSGAGSTVNGHRVSGCCGVLERAGKDPRTRLHDQSLLRWEARARHLRQRHSLGP